MDIQKYLSRPKAELSLTSQARYERYNLSENPFPSSPFVNPESTDARANGQIYEELIRQSEYEKIRHSFLEVPQSDPNHLRLGYIEDTSYLGRGNGKSAFIVNLQKRINKDFGFSVSGGINKCYAIRLEPEPGGKTKTFESFVDLFAAAILCSPFIEDALASLRLQTILTINQDFDLGAYFKTDDELRTSLVSEEWFKQAKIDVGQVNQLVIENPYLRNLPTDFPLFSTISLWPKLAKATDFEKYYKELKRGRPRYDFVFSHLVALFLAAGFNGVYVFVDDFERIPDFQSERQKRDFALELRSCLFDGLYLNARVGFYNVLFVLHAGIPRLMQAAWEQSGLEHQAPMSYKSGIPTHIIRFEKITFPDTLSLLRKYLNYYRMNPTDHEDLRPFTREAVERIAELSELNASKTLKMAHDVLERAADASIPQIDVDFVLGSSDEIVVDAGAIGGIHDAQTKDLLNESE